MVWIHGGGYSYGASTEYDPSWLVKEGNVVFVSFNYRLNVFGFFSHPALNAQQGHPVGNYGFMDQQFALTWVKDNIARFGGDPSSVTIFGESAGAACVMGHLVAEQSKNLFHKAIIQSCIAPPGLFSATLESLEEVGVSLVSLTGCTDQTIENLRRIPTKDLVVANTPPQFGRGRFPSRLMCDGKIIPKSLGALFSTGRFHRVPLIIGTNKDEYSWFFAMSELSSGIRLLEDDYARTLAGFFGSSARGAFLTVNVPTQEIEGVLQRYPAHQYVNPSRALIAAVGDAGIALSNLQTFKQLREYTDVFVYEFDVPDSPVPWPEVSFPCGSAHTLEIQFLFNLYHGASGKVVPLKSHQRDLAKTMVQYWTTFAREGHPNSKLPSSAKAPSWEVYDVAKENVMALRAPVPHMITDWGRGHNAEFWKTYIK